MAAVKHKHSPKSPGQRRSKAGARGDKRTRPGKSGPPRGQREGTSCLIFGFHAVQEALRNPARRIHNLYATKNGAKRLEPEPRATVVPVQIVDPEFIAARLAADAVHQGVLIEAAPLPAMSIEDIARSALDAGRPIILLDQVTDPHNVGAIMRSACAFGARALVVTERNAPLPAGALAKAASGTLEHLPYIRITNLSRTIDYLNDHRFQTIGLTGAATGFLEDIADNGPDRRPAALIMGAEGKGIRALTGKTCTDLAKLKLSGPITTLNVSAAAAVALQIVSGNR